MQTNESSILKIYASSTDKIGFDLLYEHLVMAAKQKGIAGVTVYRGIMGYGSSSSHIDSSRFWELTEKLPVVVEMIDQTEVLENFYHYIEEELLKLQKGCLVIMQPIDIKLLKKGK
jgi:hypothetical protein